MMLAGTAVYETHTLGQPPLVHLDFVHQGVRPDLKIPALLRRRNQHSRALEIGANRAAARTWGRIQAGRPALVRTAQHGEPGSGNRDSHALKAALDEVLTCAQRKWR